MDIKKLILAHLKKAKVMQLATSQNNQPYICSVYFVADDDLNVYWLSFPGRQHSQQIAANPKTALTVPVKLDKPVIGVQATGNSRIFKEKEVVKTIIEKYIKKYNTGHDFYDNFLIGKNQHAMYRFIPEKFVLFDEVNFASQGKQEWQP